MLEEQATIKDKAQALKEVVEASLPSSDRVNRRVRVRVRKGKIDRVTITHYNEDSA